MKKRIAKKLVRDGICPRCRCEGGISQWSLETCKRVANICDNCFTVAVIDGNGVDMSVDEEMKALAEKIDAKYFGDENE